MHIEWTKSLRKNILFVINCVQLLRRPKSGLHTTSTVSQKLNVTFEGETKCITLYDCELSSERVVSFICPSIKKTDCLSTQNTYSPHSKYTHITGVMMSGVRLETRNSWLLWVRMKEKIYKVVNQIKKLTKRLQLNSCQNSFDLLVPGAVSAPKPVILDADHVTGSVGETLKAFG